MFLLSTDNAQAWADYKESRRKRTLPATTAEECLRRLLDGYDTTPCKIVHYYSDGPYCTTHCCFAPCVIGDSLKVLNDQHK